MISRFRKLGWWRTAALTAALATNFVLAPGGQLVRDSALAAPSTLQRRDLGASLNDSSATPVAGPQARSNSETSTNRSAEGEASDGDPLDGDPLDGEPLEGDPLDGEPVDNDPGAPRILPQLEILRSGRPNDEPISVTAYDDDPATAWTPRSDSEETWLWFDLGRDEELSEIRWLTQGRGAVIVELSNDRQRWLSVDSVEAETGWQGTDVQDEARYVRLTLLADDEGEFPTIAEADVYGAKRGESVSTEQEANGNAERKKDRRTRAENRAPPERDIDDQESSGRNAGSTERRSSGRITVSAAPGDTGCGGSRARCEARQGQVLVEEDCEEEGSCTIDVRADGGTAVCDASGGDRPKAGDREGKSRGQGGRCEAVANGGAVAIGDINP